MGSSYFVYVETKVNNRWFCIDGFIPKFSYDYKEEKILDKKETNLAFLYSSGSRSYFGETMRKFREIGTQIPLSALSQELKDHWSYQGISEDEINSVGYYSPVIVDYEVFKNYVKNDSFEFHGMVHKDMLFMYDNDEIEELEAVDPEELKGLTENERQAYIYKEWDSPFGWNSHFKELKKMISQEIFKFCDNNFIDEDKLIFRIVIIER